jgi:cytochrome c oxidase subunit 2
MTRFWSRAAAAVLALGASGAALAGTGQPSPWQLNLQTPVTDVAQRSYDLHNVLVWVITAISVFVLALLVYVVVRFNEKSNPVPSKTTHHTGLEIAWTVIPIVILAAIAVPSFSLLRYQVEMPKADITVKAIGKQWYWTYEYPADQGGGFGFDSLMLSKEDAAKAGQPNLLAVDNELVLPAGKTVAIQVVGGDVIHNFAVPSIGVRMDAIPGRLNQTWFKTNVEGVYYGQCSRLCGQNHAFMPIAIRVVSAEKYAAWLVEAKKKFASNADDTVKVAARSTTVE